MSLFHIILQFFSIQTQFLQKKCVTYIFIKFQNNLYIKSEKKITQATTDGKN